jgi:hypothetical protein
MTVAIAAFTIALLLIIALFSLKSYEVRSNRVVMYEMRLRADEFAVDLKDWLLHMRDQLEQLPPMMAYLSRWLVHEAALGFAAAARLAESQAHRLAEVVSHKRSFERRETKSDFLKRVTEYKSGSDIEDTE